MEQTFETMETTPEDEVVDDKVKEVAELKEQLKKVHLMIARLQQENRQLKKVILEKTTQPSEHVPMVKATPTPSKSKGKEKVIKEDVKKAEVPIARITRYSSRKLQIQEEKIEVDEGKHTFK